MNRRDKLLLGSIYQNKKDCACETPECPPISADIGNIIECRPDGIYAGNSEEQPIFFTQDSATIQFTGSGTEADPLVAEALQTGIQNGIVSGGEVTWLQDYTYSVQPAVYYINGVQYTSPYTELTLDPADVTNNRIDVFALTTSGTAVNITGTPSTNPEQPSIDTGTQLLTSFALVVANTTSPVGLSQEYIYRENAGTPAEWAASATGNIVVNSVSNPNAGTIDIEGTAVATGNAITLVRIAGTQIAATKNVLIFYIRSKATWNNNRVLNFQFRNGVTNVGVTVPFTGTSYGFVSSITGVYQRIVIPFSAFGLTPSDTVDRLIITAAGNGGTLGFYIDDIDTQGANIISAPVETTDNIGVFYVSKNYSGIANALVNGYTLATITSSNTGYNNQVLAARMGNANKAYPCPWSARNAAMEKIASGQITKALIIIETGSNWTYGNPNSALNGSATGSSATATVADISFSSGTDISSLMKNKIDYDWRPGSGLTNIARTVAYRVGYNSDLVSTVGFKTGFYGQGDFTTVYGTLEGLSQRFIEINNPYADITFEANTCIMQRAWMFPSNYKRINIKIKKWIGDAWTSLVFDNGQTIEGDTSPCNLDVEVDEVFMGPKYFPYPSYTAQVGTRALITATPATAVRPKIKNYKLNSVYLDVTGNATLYTGWDDTVNVVDNFYVKIDIGRLKHEYNLLGAVNQGALCRIGKQTGSKTLSNTSFILNIGSADIQTPLIDGRNACSSVVTNVNNQVIVNVDYLRFRNPVSGATYALGLPLSSDPIVGEKPLYIYNIKKADIVEGYAISWNILTGYNYNANCIVKGTYKTYQALPPIYLTYGNNPSMFLDDVTLISGGTSCIDGDAVGRTIYTKNAVSNVAYSANIIQQGTLTVDTNITNYL